MPGDPPTSDFRSIDDYIAGFPPDIQALLETVRATIHAAAPEAEERISYQLPAFAQHGNLVHFAAWKTHLALYPAPTGVAAFAEEIARYGRGKGSLHFPLDEPLPLDLIRRLVQFRLA